MMVPSWLQRQGWGWRHPMGAAALAAAGVYATLDAWRDIVSIARTDAEESHVFLVPVVALWMFLVRRVRLVRCPPGGGIIGTAIVLAGWALGRVGYDHQFQSLWHGGAVLVVVGAIITVLGKHVLVRFFPAFCVLAFLVPVPGAIRQAIAMPLQQAGATAAHALLEVFGVDAILDGCVVKINGMDVAVAEACNGMRMVFALVLASYAFAFATPLRMYVRVLILLLSPLAALACNIPRLAATVLVYGNATPKFADAFHEASGWMMLPLAFLLLMVIVRAMRWALLPVGRFTLAYQ